jgi:HSP20 family protein
MTTMTRFVPLRSSLAPSLTDVAVLQQRLNSLFSDFARPAVDETGSPANTASFVPAVDIYEDEQALVLKLEVPGLKPEDLDLRVENQSLIVKGERRFEAEEKAENFHRIERRFGTFARSFTLPQTIDTESITAGYDAGVLRIQLAKKPESKPKQVKVAIGSSQSSAGAVSATA